MNRISRVAACLVLLPVLFAGCESRTDRTDSGGVLLSIVDFDGLPIRVSVNLANNIVQVDTIEVQNVPADPNGSVSSLMDVELTSYEVAYTRADTGTRVPPTLVDGIFGVAPVGGVFNVNGLPIMLSDQFRNPPLLDLFFQNGGFDKETGDPVVKINFRLRFFGRTLSGDAVQTAPANFTMEFVP